MEKLVTYFSASGVTAGKAKELARMIGADVHEIAPAVPYTKDDLDWNDKTSRSTLEMKEPASRPALKEMHPDLSRYDVIYIGYPIWWGLAPREIYTFIDQADLAGKKIVCFATSGGSGIDHSLADLKKTYPSLNVIKAKMLNDRITGDIL